MGRLMAGAVNFQIAHHDNILIAQAQENEGVRDKHAGRVQHVRVVIAVGDDEEIFRAGHGCWLNELNKLNG